MTDDRLLHSDGLGCNLMKGGIVYSSFVNTVSPSYAQEVLRAEGGKGLHELLRQYKGKFKGILNGIDTEYWNPQTDPHIFQQYSSSNIANKKLNKTMLKHKFNLDKKDKALVVVISRLVPHKSPELIKASLRRCLTKGAQFILLGSSPIDAIQANFIAIKKEYTDHKDIHIELENEEDLAHQLYAAADIIVIPSLFEPCGLTQIIGLRYGVVPVVRQTGGLQDSIKDWDDDGQTPDQRNGFTFKQYSEEGLFSALDRSIDSYHSKRWKHMVKRAMEQDFSWKHACESYLQCYQQLLDNATAGNIK